MTLLRWRWILAVLVFATGTAFGVAMILASRLVENTSVGMGPCVVQMARRNSTAV